MAKDRAVDSAVLDSGLTQIADAIREKAGTSDALAFPAGMAAAIAGISAGGSGGSGGIATGVFIPAEDMGSECDVTITHNLGEIPKLAVLYKELSEPSGFGSESMTSGEVALSIAVHGEFMGVGYYYASSSYTSTINIAAAKYGGSGKAINLSSSSAAALNGSCVHSCTTETAKLFPIKNGTKTFVAGHRYRWILMTEEVYNAL